MNHHVSDKSNANRLAFFCPMTSKVFYNSLKPQKTCDAIQSIRCFPPDPCYVILHIHLITLSPFNPLNSTSGIPFCGYIKLHGRNKNQELAHWWKYHIQKEGTNKIGKIRINQETQKANLESNKHFVQVVKVSLSNLLHLITLFSQNQEYCFRCIPRTGSSPDLEKYPKANAARSADSAQQIMGWKTFFTSDGSLKIRSQ